MTFLMPGQTAPTQELSGMRPATYKVCMTNGKRENIAADYIDVAHGRITFFNDVPKERDYIIVSFLSADVAELVELDE